MRMHKERLCSMSRRCLVMLGSSVDQYCRSLSYDDGVEAFGGVASSRIDSGPVWQGSDEEEASAMMCCAASRREDAKPRSG